MRTVVKIVLNNTEGKTLLNLRDRDHSENPGAWALLGGGVDEGENRKEALVRECKEELGLDVEVGEMIFRQRFDLYKPQQEYFYLCKVKGGELGTGEGLEFTESDGHDGSYEVQEIPLKDLDKYDLLPEELKKIVYSRFRSIV